MSYNYNIESISSGIAAGLMTFLEIFSLIVLGIAVIQIVGQWKIFTKANKPGWAALIPIYNKYTLCKITGVNPWWILITCCGWVLNVIPIIGSLAYIALMVYFAVLLNVSLSRSFGKEDAFALGLIFLQPVFNMILGFGKCDYLGEKPMNDVVFNKVGETMNSNKTTTSTNGKFCTSCGSKITSDTRFCPNCGKEVK